MFTWMWSNKYRQLSQRLSALKDSREETVFSPDLSAQTLAVAPDFWARQHGAVTYVQHQIQRVSGQMRLWGGTVLLAIMADALLVVGGLSLVQRIASTQESAWQASEQGGMNGVKEELLRVMRQGSPAEQMMALEMLNRMMGYEAAPSAIALDTPTVALDPTSTDSLVQAIYTLGQSRSPQAIDPLVMRLADPRSDVRISAVHALTEVSIAVGDARGWDAIHQLLLNESDYSVRQTALQSIARMTNYMGIPN
ncbi:MAG: hypothetical protein OHK0012_02780 [Synechococcales cyanobacterium]